MPVAVRSKTYLCSRLIAGIAGSNPTEGMEVRPLCLCCVGSGLCDGLTTRSQETYRVFVCVCVCAKLCDLETSTMRLPRADMGYTATEKIVNMPQNKTLHSLYFIKNDR
jgi:hypothetical protein